MSKIDNFISAFNVDIECLSIGGLSLVEFDAHGRQLPLESIHALLVGSVVQKSYLGVLSTLNQAFNETLGDIAGSVQDDKFHDCC